MNRLELQSSPDVRATSYQKTEHTYKEAVRALNGLVSNATARATAVQHPDDNLINYSKECSRRIGMTMEDVDQLSVIHVAGTKGKGSTCAYTESILRKCGYKTGFFSSPHLMDLTERIRINGIPISKDKFSEYFWHVYSHLDATKDNYPSEDQMPAFFQFLTTMALFVFLKEDVDVAILEVGIGGQYDCTNVVRYPVVCGISSLGFDHQNMLGSTLDAIAWQKAGIFKHKVPAITQPQPPKAMSVLMERAQEIGCPLYVIPEFQDYDEISKDFALSSLEPFQQQNISLALQLSKIWLNNHDRDSDSGDCTVLPGSEFPPTISTDIPPLRETLQGIKTCQWLGRAQILKIPGFSYYLDGAHTLESMRVCCQWFQKKATAEIKSLPKNEKVVRILIFNLTGSRKPKPLFSLLKHCSFDIAVFTSISLDTNLSENKDSIRCKMFKRVWHELDSGNPDLPEFCKIPPQQITEIFPSINDAISWCQKGQIEEPLKSFRSIPSILREATHVQVLVTGSIHLVGGVLSVLKADVSH